MIDCCTFITITFQTQLKIAIANMIICKLQYFNSSHRVNFYSSYCFDLCDIYEIHNRISAQKLIMIHDLLHFLDSCYMVIIVIT